MYEKAQVYFEKALELPGTGLKRWRDKPPALSECLRERWSAQAARLCAMFESTFKQSKISAFPVAAGTGELTSALYNIACCRSQLGDVENALVAIAGAIEQGEAPFCAAPTIVVWVWC